MEVLDACYDTGLEVVPVVCDMAANNGMALKRLMFLKTQLTAAFMIKKLQLYLNLHISLNVPTTFTSGIILQMFVRACGVVCVWCVSF
jgi:hypothetical protein